jgi:hypothetical protein
VSIQDTVNRPISAFVVAVGFNGPNDRFQLEGTAFLIGTNGFMLTAAHVAEVLREKSDPVAVFFNDQHKPVAVKIVGFECHSTEDVAVMKLSDGNWSSIHEVSPAPYFGSSEVMMWAYPENVATEHQRSVPPNDPEAESVRPDLIYFQGYIRRRINSELPVGLLRGRAFYEVSQIGGGCASGAPITIRRANQQWQVIGIYIGEQTSDARREIGIVVRADAFHDWTPALIGKAISAERANLKN